MKIYYLCNISLLLSLSSMAVEIELGHNQKKYQLVAMDTETLKDLRFKPLSSWISPISRENQDQHALGSNELGAQCGEPLKNYIEKYTRFWGNSDAKKEEILKELSGSNKYDALLKINLNPFPKNDLVFQNNLDSALKAQNQSHLLPYFRNVKTISIQSVNIHFLENSATKVFRKDSLLKNLEEVLIGQSYTPRSESISINIKALDLWCDLYQNKIEIELGLLVTSEDYQYSLQKLKNSDLDILKNFLEKERLTIQENKAEDKELSYLMAGQKMARLMEEVPALEKNPHGQDALFPLAEILFSPISSQLKLEEVSKIFTKKWSQAAIYQSKTTLGALDLGLEQTNNQGSATNENQK